VVFALGTGASGRTSPATLVGALAADVLAEAVLRAVRTATSLHGTGLPDLPSAAEFEARARSRHDKKRRDAP